MIKAAFGLLFVLAVSLLTGDARSEPVELIFAHVGEPGSLYDLTANEFARRANERFGDRVHVTVAGNSALGGDTTLLQKVTLGSVTFALPATVMSSVDDVFGIFEMPFLIRSRSHMARVRAAIFNDTLQPAAEARGYRILAVWELGFRQIVNNVRPISTPEDLKGLRLRIPKGYWRARMFEAYGAKPMPTPFKEALDDLKNGSVDGAENALQQIYSAHWNEVTKYLTISNHLYSPAFVVVSEEHFSKLPKDVQDGLTQIAVDLEAWDRKMGAKLDRETLAKMRGRIKINEIDLIEFFHTAAVGIYNEFAKKVPNGEKLIDRVDALGHPAL